MSIDRVALGLVTPGDSKTVNLATEPALARVRLDIYAQGLTELPVCNDVGIAQTPLTSNQAVSGTVTLTLETAPGAPGDTYVVSARTSNVHIINAKGADEVVQDDTFAHALAPINAGGWSFRPPRAPIGVPVGEARRGKSSTRTSNSMHLSHVDRKVYQAFGVRHLWFVDPEARALETFELDASHYRLVDVFFRRRKSSRAAVRCRRARARGALGPLSAFTEREKAVQAH